MNTWRQVAIVVLTRRIPHYATQFPFSAIKRSICEYDRDCSIRNADLRGTGTFGHIECSESLAI